MKLKIVKKYLNIEKKGMNSVLNLNTTWTARNFLNYIKHSFSGTVADCYDSLNEEGKNEL